MTLAELAALAAKVEGFKRPTRKCEWCGGEQWGNRLEPCGKCDDNGRTFDVSPAALLMAVAVWNYAKGRDLQSRSWLWGYNFIIRDGADGRGLGDLKDGTPEAIARAALVALLRAHGVEVAGE